MTDEQKGSSNHTNLTMIRRFNNHSTMVLKACEANKRTATVTSDSTDNLQPRKNDVNNETCQTSHTEPQAKKVKMNYFIFVHKSPAPRKSIGV